MQVSSLGQEDLLEEETATHSSIFAWEIPRTEEPGGLQSKRSKESDMTQQTKPPSSKYIGKKQSPEGDKKMQGSFLQKQMYCEGSGQGHQLLCK